MDEMTVLVSKNVRVYSVSRTDNANVGILFSLRVIDLSDPNADTTSPTGISIDMSTQEAEKLRDFLTSVLQTGQTRISGS